MKYSIVPVKLPGLREDELVVHCEDELVVHRDEAGDPVRVEFAAPTRWCEIHPAGSPRAYLLTGRKLDVAILMERTDTGERVWGILTPGDLEEIERVWERSR